MKNRLYIFIGLVMALLLGVWWVRTGSEIPSQKTPTTNVNSTNKSFSVDTPVSFTAPHTNSMSASQSWWSEENPKVKAFKAEDAKKNAQPQDFYGRVIDQHGQVIVEAEVTGTLGWIQGFNEGPKTQIFKTETDSNGEFQFTGIFGWQLSVVPKQPGYELARNTDGIQLPPSGKTLPSNRAIFTMWKLKGHEPMVHATISTGVPCDGTATSFDLLRTLSPLKIEIPL